MSPSFQASHLIPVCMRQSWFCSFCRRFWCVCERNCSCEKVCEREEKQGVKCHRPWTVWIREDISLPGPKQYSLIHNGQKTATHRWVYSFFVFLLVFALWLSNSEERKKQTTLFFILKKISIFKETFSNHWFYMHFILWKKCFVIKRHC